MFFINFIRILWSLWDQEVRLFDIPKDIVFEEILFLPIFLIFWGIKRAKKWKISAENVGEIKAYLGEKGSQILPKWAIAWMLNQYENV